MTWFASRWLKKTRLGCLGCYTEIKVSSYSPDLQGSCSTSTSKFACPHAFIQHGFCGHQLQVVSLHEHLVAALWVSQQQKAPKASLTQNLHYPRILRGQEASQKEPSGSKNTSVLNQFLCPIIVPIIWIHMATKCYKDSTRSPSLWLAGGWSSTGAWWPVMTGKASVIAVVQRWTGDYGWGLEMKADERSHSVMVLGDRMQLALIDSAAHGRELPQVSGFGGRMFFSWRVYFYFLMQVGYFFDVFMFLSVAHRFWGAVPAIMSSLERDGHVWPKNTTADGTW